MSRALNELEKIAFKLVTEEQIKQVRKEMTAEWGSDREEWDESDYIEAIAQAATDTIKEGTIVGTEIQDVLLELVESADWSQHPEVQ